MAKEFLEDRSMTTLPPEHSLDAPPGLRWLRKGDLEGWEVVEARALLDTLEDHPDVVWQWGDEHIKTCGDCGVSSGQKRQLPAAYRCRFSAAVELVYGFVSGVMVKG